MELSEKTIEVLNKYEVELITAISVKLQEKNKFGSGNITKELKPEIVSAANEIHLQLKGSDALLYVETGRSPGKLPPSDVISVWVAEKGLPEKAVFGIMKNIGKFGIPPSPYLQEVINGVSPKLVKDLSKIIVEDIKEKIRK